MELERILREKRVLVCCGSGGVGKTTTAASLALYAASIGRKTLVLTIDPARRLANALGFATFSRDAQLVAPELFRAAGLEAKAELRAMMLDVGGTFDGLIERYAKSDEVRQRILGNKLYRNLSATLAGSHEYMAMEKLYELYSDGDYDLIVLDTPPTRNALDFLDAPERLVGFLDEGILKWFLKPYYSAGRAGFKLLQRGGTVILTALERVSGSGFLHDLSDFFQAFEGMYGGFRQRAELVTSLLASQETMFLLVTGPTRVAIDEAIYFYEKLREYNFGFSTFVVNRVHLSPLGERPRISDPELLAELEDAGLQEGAAKGLLDVSRQIQVLGDRNRASLGRLRESVLEDEVDYRLVPALEQDVHDLSGLAQIADAILAGG